MKTTPEIKPLNYKKPDILVSNKPFKYADVVRKLTEAFSIGCSVSEACLYADISRDTYYRWIKNNKTLSDRFNALLERPILKARKTINENLNDPRTAAWYLERKRKDEFAPKSELEHKFSEDIERKKLGNLIDKITNDGESGKSAGGTGEAPAKNEGTG